MTQKEILAACDHTLLRPEAGWEEIKTLCDEAIEFKTASVCIPPSFVKRAREYAGGSLRICTVVGFPNGYSATPVKVFETTEAIADGADEIDMVIAIGAVKEGRLQDVKKEIEAVKEACRGHILKVIVETCLLTQAEKIALCEIVSEAGADYIKTSTGFSTGGATREDIALFARHIGEKVKIKAAGGISDFQDAEDFLRLGASRLGTSRLVKIAKENKHE